ncbi:hypothetical protein [Streptomyces gilvosporeus]|uniref:hypothetical protein n=1 Tax=Streptomyces gilvosporeus TaxID=553510 RepID=UPI00131BBA1D|nr:hypothetical protein [Streptomyces gilvosporeus]
MPEQKVRPRPINVADISSAGIATLMVTIGFNLGSSTWPGKICIWSAPWLVLCLPPIIAAFLSTLDDRLKHWQWKGHRKRLKALHDQTTDKEVRREIMAAINMADKELSARLVEGMRGIHAEEQANT